MPDQPLMRIATLANARFREQAGNLLASLERSPNRFHLTIYCDDAALFGALGGPHCGLVELPEIQRLGPKRAKLTAFAAAVREGDVLFLDADAIVLESLEGFWGGAEIGGCADTLEYCPYIADPARPWPLAPALVNNRYINSGAFFAPVAAYPFFERMRLAGLDDAMWRQYAQATIDENYCRSFLFDGSLDDNHFFCAFLNLEDQPVHLFDPRVYGWRGFLKDGRLQVYRSGPRLLNKQTHEPLKLVIFAGIQQTPELLGSLPFEIAGLLAERTNHPMPLESEELAHLQKRLLSLKEECRAIGRLPPRPPTFRGATGGALVSLVRRLLFWYTPPIGHVASGLVETLEEAQRILEDHRKTEIHLNEEIQALRREHEQAIHPRLDALEARVQTLIDRAGPPEGRRQGRSSV